MNTVMAQILQKKCITYNKIPIHCNFELFGYHRLLCLLSLIFLVNSLLSLVIFMVCNFVFTLEAIAIAAKKLTFALFFFG